jgi:predicted phosphodiesterase
MGNGSVRVVNASAEGRKKYLLPLGDLHYGHPNCDRESVEGYLKWARDNDSWILLMGDLLENSSKDSVGAGVYEQIMSPEAQMFEIIEMLEPYKEYILGLLTGNHEERTYKRSGHDPSRSMAKMLGVPYLRYGAFLRLFVGDVGYTVYATHGSSGAGTSAGKLNAVKKLRRFIDADIYLMGHMHDLLVDSSVVKYLDLRNKVVRSKRATYCVTGSYLEYEDSYSEMKTYAPGRIGSPRIRLSGEKEDVHVSL